MVTRQIHSIYPFPKSRSNHRLKVILVDDRFPTWRPPVFAPPPPLVGRLIAPVSLPFTHSQVAFHSDEWEIRLIYVKGRRRVTKSLFPGLSISLRRQRQLYLRGDLLTSYLLINILPIINKGIKVG